MRARRWTAWWTLSQLTGRRRHAPCWRTHFAVSSRNYGGFGVGLWVARKAIEAQGGRITVDSRPGAGAEFTVELPLQPP